MNRQQEISKLTATLQRHGFGSDVTRDIASNYAEGDRPYAHIDFALAETKYDSNIRAAMQELELDVTDKGISLQLK